MKAAFEDCFRQYSLTELPQDTELAARPFSIQVYIRDLMEMLHEYLIFYGQACSHQICKGQCHSSGDQLRSLINKLRMTMKIYVKLHRAAKFCYKVLL